MPTRGRSGMSKGCRVWPNEGIDQQKAQDYCLVGVTNTMLFRTQAE